MADIKLFADLSEPLLSLLRTDATLVDGVEVGPWFKVSQVRAYRQSLPGMPFHFHAADMIENVGIVSSNSKRIEAYLVCTKSPWASVHISVWNPGEIARMKNGQRLPLPDPDRGGQRFIGKVKQLAPTIKVPVLIENVEPLPLDNYDYWARPEFIQRILEKTGCDFLLDIGHARISAECLGIDIHDYLQQLPLERVVQVHASGPRWVNGRLWDVHQPLQQEDYNVLDFVLARTQPQVVTLEYIQEAQALQDQLARLRNILEGT